VKFAIHFKLVNFSGFTVKGRKQEDCRAQRTVWIGSRQLGA